MVESHIGRIRLLEKDIDLLKKRTMVLSGATKIMASGAMTPAQQSMRSGLETPNQQMYRGRMVNQSMSRTRNQSNAPSRQERINYGRPGIENMQHHINQQVYKTPSVIDLGEGSTVAGSNSSMLRKRTPSEVGSMDSSQLGYPQKRYQ